MAFRGNEEGLRQHLDQAERTISSNNEEIASLRRQMTDMDNELRGYKLGNLKEKSKRFLAFGVGAFIGVMVIAFLGWAVESCNEAMNNSLHAGIVTDRYYSPAHDVHSVICTPIGKTTICTPHTTHYPDVWSLRFDHEGYSRLVNVDHATWDRTGRGTWFCYEEPCEENPGQ